LRLLLPNKAKNPCLKCAATVLVGNVVVNVFVTALVVHAVAVDVATVLAVDGIALMLLVVLFLKIC